MCSGFVGPWSESGFGSGGERGDCCGVVKQLFVSKLRQICVKKISGLGVFSVKIGVGGPDSGQRERERRDCCGVVKQLFVSKLSQKCARKSEKRVSWVQTVLLGHSQTLGLDLRSPCLFQSYAKRGQ